MSTEEKSSKVKPLIADTKICSICLLSGSTDDNDPIVYCDRCGIIVHESCYNADTLDEKSSDSSSPSEFWFCTPCLAQVDHPTCALCPTEDRCQPYWPTLESSWVHVVCALGIQGVLFYDELYYTPVDISNVSIQKFGNKMCQICELRSGVTVSCDAGLCPNAFHLSCAHRNGLLQIRGELSKIECELYCVTHQSTSNIYKNIQRNFSICEVQQKEFDRRNELNDEIRQCLIDHWNIFERRRESFPKLPKPTKTHLSRSLTVDPIALKEFFQKAQRLQSNCSSTANSNTTTIDLSSVETNPLLAFQMNEEELQQLKSNLVETQTKLDELESKENENELKEEHQQLEKQLKDEYEKLAELTEKYQKFIEVFRRANCSLKEETLNRLADRRTLAKDLDFCSICREKDRINQMIKCCQCLLTFHGDCLTPAIPTKTLSIMLSATKKYEWQCASCVNAQQDELDQRNVDVDQPRQIRARKTNELVLRESFLKFGSKKRKENFDATNEENKKTKNSSENTEEKPSDDNRSEGQSRTKILKKLFNRKSKEISSSSTSARPNSSKRKSSSNKKNSPRISIKKSSKEKPSTPIRSSSLPNERRTPTIFKQKALSSPTTKMETTPKKRSDPLSIFEFDDDDEKTNEIVQLRSSTTQDNEEEEEQKEKEKEKEKPERKSRRSTKKLVNEVPTDAKCLECQNNGNEQNMTDCDQCKEFYHFQCCVPPLNSFPKRKNYGWTCHRCNDQTDSD